MSQSAQELIAEAGERGLAASALACLDRCLPLLDPAPDDLLRPLWQSVAEGGAGWAERLGEVRAALEETDDADSAVLVRKMLGAAPSEWDGAALRAWAEACSLTALELHQQLGGGPLVEAEERRQVRILEFLAGTPSDGPPAAGLRPVLEVSAEARRVLRAVVSRRERGA
ncbi:hypothetical protein AMK26_08410 [Streptomyces sp. CB03234]|uniref:hypothetical protein n=1 Tax=Streptomyces sp. (strain CB03234) TaxID=1703937 RepID=UPI000938D8B9|nr:hypothetical protein [Streptomyces sp. CB03234]OKK06092.1 hypothetical protein AMK26_08410 [Streptomyces sp. CB03234]